eukprot:TRINITY_DN1155_c0_g1_i3.p1 TRINITY_DN1155_c0_g1~~TRINITY_DN1155_c0_g1_i3.p1  ORF type:complete len:113 (-),score=9.88 TRINITY_DN1155_c0_g1_i3:205-543(-)
MQFEEGGSCAYPAIKLEACGTNAPTIFFSCSTLALQESCLAVATQLADAAQSANVATLASARGPWTSDFTNPLRGSIWIARTRMTANAALTASVPTASATNEGWAIFMYRIQ